MIHEYVLLVIGRLNKTWFVMVAAKGATGYHIDSSVSGSGMSELPS